MLLTPAHQWFLKSTILRTTFLAVLILLTQANFEEESLIYDFNKKQFKSLCNTGFSSNFP